MNPAMRIHDRGDSTRNRQAAFRWQRRATAAALLSMVWCTVAGCPYPTPVPDEDGYHVVDSPDVEPQNERDPQGQLEPQRDDSPAVSVPSGDPPDPPAEHQDQPQRTPPASPAPPAQENTPRQASSADCPVSAETTPDFMPPTALLRANDLVLTVGGDLNQFWEVDACVFAADAAQFPEIQNNAFAVRNPAIVAYDPGFFGDLANQWGNETPVLVVIAHEWGHQVQYAYDLFPPNAYTFDLEQDADWRAGYYLGSVAQSEGLTNFGEISKVLAEFACSLGDPDGYPWYADGAHGTCDQRAQAIAKGFDEAVNTSEIGREPRQTPGAPAPMAGTWEGPLTMYVTVVQDGQAVAPTETLAGDYWFTADENGRIIDDFGTGPIPDVGEERHYPLATEDLSLDMYWLNEAISFDDNAIRYDWSVEVPQGVVAGSIPVSGSGFATDLYVFESQDALRCYSYVSLTLVPSGEGAEATVVVESVAQMTRR